MGVAMCGSFGRVFGALFWALGAGGRVSCQAFALVVGVVAVLSFFGFFSRPAYDGAHRTIGRSPLFGCFKGLFNNII